MLKLLITLLVISVYMANAIKLELTNGRVEGQTVKLKHQKLHLFKKLPFAEPPLGDLRFRKPQPALNWSGTLNATEYGPSCMVNKTNNISQIGYSEDCLHMNVFSSQKCLLTKKCPVVVLIYGGGFKFGNGVQYNESHILKKFVQHDIVFVLSSYRVGFFGILDLGHDLEDAPYNVALYDIIFGLEWIQQEIRTFGGDSSRVTLLGYSSGATAIQYLMSSPQLQDHDLFSQVVLSSGLPVLAPGYSRDITKKFLELVECGQNSTSNSNHTLSTREQLDCLRALPAKEISDKEGELIEWWNHLSPQSNRDLLPARSYAKLAENRQKSIPMFVITSELEMGNLYEPIETIEHVCRENLRIFDYVHEETVQACVRRYEDTNDTYPIVRDIYHAVAVQECQLNNKEHFNSNGKDSNRIGYGMLMEKGEEFRKRFPGKEDPKNPCYLGIFAQLNHSIHAGENLYLLGRHIERAGNLTINDELMDKYYPNLIRNFIRGQPPVDSWSPTNNKGEGYFWLSFQVLSDNQTEHEWPHMVEDKIYDSEAVNFILEYLSAVEKNASQFHRLSDEFATQAIQPKLVNLFNKEIVNGIVNEEATTNSQEHEERHEREELEYQRLYGYTSLWTIFLLTIILLVFGIVFQMKGRRRQGYSLEPLQPVIIRDKQPVLNYQAI